MACSKILCVLVASWLSTHGYDPAHREAVLNYIAHESDFEPDVVERTGACLFQWAGQRRRYALSLGRGRCPPWEVQMLIADRELRGPFAGFWRAHDPRTHMRAHFGRGALDR